MYTGLGQSKRLIPAILGTVTLAGVAALLSSDAFPRFFPAGSHRLLAAFSLATITLAYLAYQIAHWPTAMEFLKGIMLAVAFLFWAANQFWPELSQASLFNDIAITLFVLDVFLVIVGWPRTSPDSSFGEAFSGSCAQSCAAHCREEECCVGRAN